MNVKKTSKFITIAIIILLSLAFFACGANFEYDKDAALSKAKQAADCLNTGNYRALYNLLDEDLQNCKDVDNISSKFTNFIEYNKQAGKFIKYNEDEKITGLIKNDTKYIKVYFTSQCEKNKMSYEIIFDTDMDIVSVYYGTVVSSGFSTQEKGAFIATTKYSILSIADFDVNTAIQKAKDTADAINARNYNAMYKMLEENLQNGSPKDQVISSFEQIAEKTGKFIKFNDDVKYQDFKQNGVKYLSVYFTAQCEKTNAKYEVIFDKNMNIMSVAYGSVTKLTDEKNNVQWVYVREKGIKFLLK